MNALDSFRPVTRRALSIRYTSPGICRRVETTSGSSSGDLSSLGYLETTRLTGPTLFAATNGSQIDLSWTEVSGAAFYQVFRSLSETGPFTFLQGPISGTEYSDTPPTADVYYYQVTAVEPIAGETDPSNVATGIVAVILPGATLHLAPESYMSADVATDINTGDGDQVRRWNDLSGSGNHAVYGVALNTDGPRKVLAGLNGLTTLKFGDPAIDRKTGLVAPATSTAEATLFVVSSFKTTGDPAIDANAQRVACYGRTSLQVRKFIGSNPYNRAQAASVAGSTPTTAPDEYENFQVFAARANATHTSIFRAGVLAQEISGGSAAPAVGNQNISVGFEWPGSSGVAPLLTRTLTGHIAEVIFYPFALTNDEVYAVSAFLKSKFAL